MASLTAPSEGLRMVEAMRSAGWVDMGTNDGATALRCPESSRVIWVPRPDLKACKSADLDSVVHELMSIASAGDLARQALENMQKNGAIL